MSSTLVQLRNEIIANANIAGHKDFNILRLNRMINLASRYVQIQLNGLGIKKWEASFLFAPTDLISTTYSGIAVTSIPMSLLPNIAESPNSILLIECTGTETGIALEENYKKFAQVIKGSYSPTEAEPRFMRLNNLIYLSPSTISVANVFYHKIISDLIIDTDKTEVPMEFERFIIKKVTMEIQDIIHNVIQNESVLDKEIQVAYEKFLNIEQQENKAELV